MSHALLTASTSQQHVVSEEEQTAPEQKMSRTGTEVHEETRGFFRSLSELIEHTEPFLRARKGFRRVFLPGRGFSLSDPRAEELFREVVREFSVVVSSATLREFRGEVFLSWTRELIFLEREELFHALEEKDYEKVRELLKSDYIDRGYVFGFAFGTEPYEVFGCPIRNFCFLKALLTEDREVIKLFLKHQKRPLQGLTVFALEGLLLRLAADAAARNADDVIESAVRNPIFETMFFHLTKEDLEAALERAPTSGLNLHACASAINFLYGVLGEEALREKFGEIKLPLQDPLYEGTPLVLAKIYRRDPSVAVWTMKLLEVRPKRERSPVL